MVPRIAGSQSSTNSASVWWLGSTYVPLSSREISTHDATDGKTVLGEALRPEAARKVLREKALVVGQIGSWGVSYSDRWREPVEGHKGNSVYIGAGSAEEVDRAEELANRRIRREYGETIPPLDVVVAIYEEALCEARSSRGRGRD